ncbi:hypothetical protein PNEG_00368 [Pneumocystis murina B123]|uniref:Uncharacterized protein n=1 Tax=Pneumocystis murina (strain B123) TaxID=1069680 RepID=M7PLL5_PNEMU|nr:hypothetical protein PNEG_00368 [Pneumocystis murina B123]EMR11339.1 hypothetical protein PNEG_00368 [Pneumocystis murina B123]
MTDLNIYIPVTNKNFEEKVNLKKKKESDTLLKIPETWNFNRDLSNVSSIFKEKIKWDSLSLKKIEFHWKNYPYYLKYDAYKSKQEKNQEKYQKIEYIKSFPEYISDNSKTNITILNEDNQIIKNNELTDNNLTKKPNFHSKALDNSQKITYKNHSTISIQKNNEKSLLFKTNCNISTHEFVSKKESFNYPISPIARNPFPLTILGKSVISGLSSNDTLLRTCFRVGEALKVSNLQKNSMIIYLIEFFGIIKEFNKEKSLFTYVIADLFHPLRGPYIYASYHDYHITITFQNNDIVRILGVFKKNRTRNEINVIKMYPCTWEKIQHIKETMK